MSDDVRRAPGGGHGLGPLEDAYEIESELHRSRAIVTYVAKQREEGRRVTITVLEAATPSERNALTHLAADARLLTNARHPHVLPVLETRWLAASRLGLVRVRARGSTLRHTLDSVGPMPEPRVVEILRELGDVLEWACRSGIVHRNLDSESICFQKGSGRVMVSFGLPAIFDRHTVAGGDAAFHVERCVDGATLARLACEMLTAHRAGDASVETLRAVRSDVSERTLEAIEAGLRCGSGTAPVDARRFITLLTGAAPAVGAAAIATAASAPVVPRGATTPVPPPRLPLGGPTVGNPGVGETAAAPTHATPAPALPVGRHPGVVTAPAGPPPRRRRGRGLFLASMLALVALVGSTFWLITRQQDETRVAENARPDTNDGEEAGDVELPPDPGGLTVGGAPAVDPAPAPQLPAPTQTPGATATAPPAEAPDAPVTTPVTTPVPPPVAAAPRARNACESPAPADQRACFTERLAARDAELNSVYQALIREVGRRRGADAVEALRYQQRAWIDDRDRRCRDAGGGDVWAVRRVACLGEISDARALSLARELARVRSGM